MNKETARQRLEDMTKSFLEKIPEDNNLMRRELQTWMDGAKIHLDVIYDKKNAEISDDFRVIKEYSKISDYVRSVGGVQRHIRNAKQIAGYFS